MNKEFEPHTEHKPFREREITRKEFEQYFILMETAIKNAPFKTEISETEQNIDEIIAKFIRGEVKKEDLEKALQHVPQNSVVFPNFRILKAILSVILPSELKEQINNLIEHERAHLEKAKKLGFKGEIGVQVIKSEDGQLRFKPYVTTFFSIGDIPEDELPDFKNKIKEIASAPKNPSLGDKKIIDN